MSKHNKVNPGQYTQAGRLSADDAAREYSKQSQPGIGHRDTTAAEHRERKDDPPTDRAEKDTAEQKAHEGSADVDSSATKTDGTSQATKTDGTGQKPGGSR